MISKDDYLYFVNDALDGMTAIVSELGDELANRRPDLPGANSAFALLTHCLGVMTYWGVHLVAGREVERDRDAEFVSRGSVADLLDQARQVRHEFERAVAGADPEAVLRGTVPPEWTPDVGPFMQRQGAALMHVYEELAQHRGHMELTRDLVARSVGGTPPVEVGRQGGEDGQDRH